MNGNRWERQMRQLRQCSRGFGLIASLLALALVGACDDATGPASGGQAVSLSFAIGAGTPGVSPFLFGGAVELSDGTNTLVIESAEMVLREIEFERVDDNACDVEIDHDDCEKFEVGPLLVALPLDGSVSQEITAQVEEGTYDEIEFDVHKIDSADPASAELIGARPDLDGISIKATGTYNGQSFVFTSDLNEEQEIELTSMLIIGPDAEPTNVTLTLDVTTWFATVGGALLDPATANKGEPNENLVKDNIKNSIEGFRDDDADGVPHDEDDDEDDSDAV